MICNKTLSVRALGPVWILVIILYGSDVKKTNLNNKKLKRVCKIRSDWGSDGLSIRDVEAAILCFHFHR